MKGNHAETGPYGLIVQAFQKYNKKPAIPGFRPKQSVTNDHSRERGTCSN
jgi:hypothetical protein